MNIKKQKNYWSSLMSEDTTVTQLKKAITPIYKTSLEEDLYHSIISQFYHHDADSMDIEKILTELYRQFDDHEISLGEIIKYKDDMYLGVVEPNSGVDGISKLLTANYDKKTAVNVAEELKAILTPFDSKNVLTLPLSETKFVKLDAGRYEVVIQNINFNRKGKDNSDYLRVLSCYPSKIIIHDNPISDAGRTFTIHWITKNGGSFTTDSMLIPEIETYLENHAYVLSPKQLRGTIAAIIQISIDNNLAKIKNEIETPGFYWNSDTEQIDIIEYEYQHPTTGELIKSLELIEELKHFFRGQEAKLATTLKHALIVPFGFAKKQMGLPLENLIPYLYHYGKAGSGKTTAARIGTYFWGEPSTENDIGGSEFDTIARLGAQVSKSTFLLIVNEPDTVFKRPTLTETMKTCVERTNARRRFEGKTFQTILSLATVQFTSNHALPNDEGLARRFLQILYSHSEKKTDIQKDAFMKKYRMDQPAICRFHDLKPLANFSLNYIRVNPEVLRLNWRELSNKLMMQAYIRCGRQVPEWLLEFVESVTLEDLDDEETEELRMFFIDEINKRTKNIKVYSNETGYPLQEELVDFVKGANDFHERVFNVINERQIPYMVMHHASNGRDYVCFTSGLKKALHNANQACYNVKSIAELLGWNYKTVKLPKPTKVMIIRFDKFLKFLYPNYDEMEDF